MSTEPAGLCLLGLGTIFDAIATDPAGHGLPEGWTSRRAESVALLAASMPSLLEGLDPEATRIFVAVDEHALNYARLELYGAARLRGLRTITLRHASASVAPEARIDDNCWIAAGASVARGAHLQSDVMLHARARVDADAKIGPHGWIGPGASIGASATVGGHCVVGADMRLRAGVSLGKHCVADTASMRSTDMPPGSFDAPAFAQGARMVGAGCTFEKIRR